MYASTASMNMNAKGKSNLLMLQQRQQKAQPDQESPKGKGVRLERAQMSAQFSKTEMCKFHLLGVCTKGSACAFAHSDVELKSRPDLSRTRLCRVFLQTGQCDDKNCSFAHSKDQLRTTDFFHKTKLCRFWQAGHCILDDKCRFAHSTGELKKDVLVDQTPQPQNLQCNNTMPIPAMLNQIQLLLQQREQLQQLMSQSQQSVQQQRNYQEQPPMEIYSGCATPEYHDFDTGAMQALCPATLQDKLEMASSTCDSQDADGSQDRYWPNSDSNLFDDEPFSPEPETTPCEDRWAPSGLDSSDSYGSSTPDFPPIYGEGQVQVPVKMMPQMQMQRLPLLLAPAPQTSMIGNESGDPIEHYAGDMEIMQAPLPSFNEDEETPFDSFNGIWESESGYQVKNTFISVKNNTYKPLRCVRSAAGRLTEMRDA